MIKFKISRAKRKDKRWNNVGEREEGSLEVRLVEGSSPNSLKPPLSTAGITNYKELLIGAFRQVFIPTFDIELLSNFISPPDILVRNGTKSRYNNTKQWL